MATYQEVLDSISIDGYDNVEDWNINSMDFDKKEEIRQKLFADFFQLSIHREYSDHPDSPKKMGYRGWIEMPEIGTVGFSRTDGTANQFRW